MQIFTLALAAESVVAKNKGEGDKKQQKRGNVETSSSGVSGSTGYSLGSAGELGSSEKYSYGGYDLGSGSIGLSSGSIGDGKAGLISGSTGYGKVGLISGNTGHGNVALILGNIGHDSTGLSFTRGLLSSGGYGLRGYSLGSHLSSGSIVPGSIGSDSGLSSGKLILLGSRGLGHDSGQGIGVGSGIFGGAGFYGGIPGTGSGTGQVHVTTLTQKVPVRVPQPVPVIVSKPVPVSVPAPYPVEVPRPVPVSIPQAVRVTVIRPYPVTVSRPVPVAVTRPYAVAVPRPLPVHVHQPLTVAVPVPQPVLVSSVSDSGYSGGVGGLGSSAGGYSTGSSHGSPVSSIGAVGYSGVVGGLGLSSGGGYAYESSYGSSGLGLGHLSTPLKGVYVPSYLGGLYGSSGSQSSSHGPSGVYGSADYAGSSSAGYGYGSYSKS